MGRRIAIALGLSLALNVFLGGFFAGRIVAPGFHAQTMPYAEEVAGKERELVHRRADGAGARADTRGLGGRGARPAAMLGDPRLLPQDARETFRDALRRNRPEWRVAGSAMREQRQRVRDALTAEPFNRAAAEEAFQALIQLDNERETRAVSVMLDVFGTLDVNDRVRLVEAGKRGRRQGGRLQPEEPDTDEPPIPGK